MDDATAIADCLALSRSLTGWEVNFLQHLQRQLGAGEAITRGQRRKLLSIRAAVCPDPETERGAFTPAELDRLREEVERRQVEASTLAGAFYRAAASPGAVRPEDRRRLRQVLEQSDG
jgi:Na+-transporting NADH:ubiquinone oxidoreductase subunit NqrA